MGGSSILPPTKDFPRGAGRRELSQAASCGDEGYDLSPEPPLLFLEGFSLAFPGGDAIMILEIGKNQRSRTDGVHRDPKRNGRPAPGAA